MAINYGTDITIFPDLDLTFSVVTDYQQVLLEDAYKKLTTPPGLESPPTGQFWDTNTLDLRSYLGDQLSPRDLAALESRILAIFDSELRYNVSLVLTFAQGLLTVNLTLYPSQDERPIGMVITVTENDITNISFQRSV